MHRVLNWVTHAKIFEDKLYYEVPNKAAGANKRAVGKNIQN